MSAVDRPDPAAHLVAGPAVTRDKLAVAKSLRREAKPSEDALWQRLRGSQLDGLHFRRQQVIDGLIVDFYCHSARLAVEVDGQIHHNQREYDAEREAVLHRRGVQVLRVANERVERDIASVLRLIAAAAVKSKAQVHLSPLPFRA